MTDNLLAAIPDSNLPEWSVRWRDGLSGATGLDSITAEHAERARREYQREHPDREVVGVSQMYP